MLSYTEELVSEYYRHLEKDGKPEFFVSEHVHFRGKKKVKGWRDIDILAIGNTEIHIVQTKSFAIYRRTKKESIDDVVQLVNESEDFVRRTYDVTNKKIKKVFIADAGLSKSMMEELKSAHLIDVVKRLKDITKELFQILLEKYPKMLKEVGKEESNVTRTLLFLMYSFKQQLKKAGLF